MATNNSSSSSSTSTVSLLPLQDRVAIITGASRGIGKGIALHLSSLGAKIVINYTSDSSQSLANDLVSHLNAPPPSSPRAVAVQADVSDPAQVKALFDAADRHFGSPPHILVTNAGVADPAYKPIPDIPVSEFDRIFAVNTRGTFLCVQEAARRIKRGGGGRIVTVSTSLVAALLPGYGVYTASKAAVEAMTKVLAKEMKGTGVTVNCVAPGPTETEMFYDGKTEELVRRKVEENPMGRLGTVEDVAALVGFLVGDAAEFVNGQIVRINGGYV